MAISFVGHAFAIATTVNLPAGCIAYDIAIVQAFRSGSATPPTVPSGWTSISAIASSSTISQVAAYKILTGSETNIGTWVNATSVQVCVYRGVAYTSSIGISATGAATAGTLDTPNLNLTHTDGTSWVVTFAAMASDTSMYSGVLTGHTNRSSGNGAGGYIGMWDIANPTSYTSTVYYPSGASTRIIAHSLELVVATTAPPETDYVWEITAGALPAGLTLDAATGEISGTATDIDGVYEFTIIASNNTFATTSFTCQITVWGSGLPSCTWGLDIEKLVTQKDVVWQRHTRVATRPVVVQGTTLLYANENGVAYFVDRDDVVASGAYWISPTLNRGKRDREYSLKEVNFRYESDGDVELYVYGSANGGKLWKEGNYYAVFLAQTHGEIRRGRMSFDNHGVTGYDVRFKFEFPGDGVLRIHEWTAKLVERGGLRRE